MNVSYAYFFAKYKKIPKSAISRVRKRDPATDFCRILSRDICVCSNGLEQSVQLCVDSVDDLAEVFRILFELEFVDIHYQ